MRSIGEFFSRIQNKQTQELFLRKGVQDALKKVMGLEVPVEKISFKGGNVVVSGLSQTAKAQLFIKKTAILNEINGSIKTRAVKDIHF